jgi:hypothetical protein
VPILDNESHVCPTGSVATAPRTIEASALDVVDDLAEAEEEDEDSDIDNDGDNGDDQEWQLTPAAKLVYSRRSPQLEREPYEAALLRMGPSLRTLISSLTRQ